MTIRYKLKPEVTREVREYSVAHWIGPHHEIYDRDHWEPVPEKRWVPCEVAWVHGCIYVDGEPAMAERSGQRHIIIAPGTVRFEREES